MRPRFKNKVTFCYFIFEWHFYKDNRLTGTNKAVEPAGIAASEVLEGQSILSLKHNNLWSMMPSAGASGHQSPSGLIKFG